MRGCESSSENGVQAQDRFGQSDLSGTQMHGRTGDRDHQRGAGLPPVLLAWGPGGGWRVVSGLFGFQSQALPYLILCVVRVVANPARALVTNTCSIHVWAKIIA